MLAEGVPLSCEPVASQSVSACRIPGKGRTTTGTARPNPIINHVSHLINEFCCAKYFYEANIVTFLSSLRADTSNFATLVSVISSA